MQTNLTAPISVGQLIDLLNDDLSREVQAVTGCANAYRLFAESQFSTLAAAVKAHADVELTHAITLVSNIDSLGGVPVVTPRPTHEYCMPDETLRQNLAAGAASITRYQARLEQCEMLGERRVAESIRQILAQERAHFATLMTVLIDAPHPARECEVALASARE